MEHEIHNDDEPIMRLNCHGIHNEEQPDIELDGGKVEVTIFNKQDAPLEQSPFKVLLELHGVADDSRLGIDLVTILDISDSMNEIGLLKMKLAMDFLAQKLSSADRLSVITFNSHGAFKLCPLRQITENSRKEIADKVNDLVAGSSTNTEAGLNLALKVLNDRSNTKNRSVAIMLMSNGVADAESRGITVPISEVPVYTFAFGSECDHEVLRGISENSKGGTFSAVQDSDDLTVAFSTALAGLLNVCIEDLSLTVAPLNSSQLNKVNADFCPQTEMVTVMEPITVTFGSLYDRETRKVFLNLTLPEVDKRFSVAILKLEFKYRVNGKEEFDSDEQIINVTRTAEHKDGEIPQVLAEETRIETASLEARILAFALALEDSHKKPETYVVPTAEPEDCVTERSPVPEAPKQEGWGLGRLKKAAAAGMNKATEAAAAGINMASEAAEKLRKEHDLRAAFPGKK
ncbi:hypothetical protein MKW94_023334 [Papaver nudicaule]|uniref:VWFA domain-containing protein n=1 Tax=Papaver nudicaule TaxID=74823 RepID=A0AA41UV13_PAPNU|nr:hypothetical protein [Papaver nudicaule]